MPRIVARLLTVVALAAPPALTGCGSDPTSQVNDTCSLNSMCNKPLVCAFDHCHVACVETRDCPTMQRCVHSPDGNVCQYNPECAYKSNCPAPLTCAIDRQCRNDCLVDGDCPTKTQKCLQPDKVCAEPSELDATGTRLAKAQSTPVPDGPDAGADGGPDAPDAAAADSGDVASPVAPSDAAGPLGFVPSNFVLPAQGAGDAGAPPPVAISQPACDNHCLPAPTSVMMADGALADLYVVDTLRVETTAVLALTGPRPVVIAALDTVDIEGQLSVAAVAGVGGPGGFSSGVAGPGAGAMGQTAAAMASGGGGASYCGLGGHAGVMLMMAGTAAGPGKAYGTPEIIPLVGGSPGGTSSWYGTVLAGAGGGALQIVARTSIKVGMFGSINAGGGGGSAPAAGGGSGGAVLLEAPVITIAGHLGANGGGGGGSMIGRPGTPASADDQPAAGGAPAGKGSAAGDVNGSDAGMDWAGGGGGAGRIRLNTATGAATLGASALVSPALTTPCATQGRIGR